MAAGACISDAQVGERRCGGYGGIFRGCGRSRYPRLSFGPPHAASVVSVCGVAVRYADACVDNNTNFNWTDGATSEVFTLAHTGGGVHAVVGLCHPR